MSSDKERVSFETLGLSGDDPSTDEAISTIEKLFVDHVQYGHFMDGQTPARRAAFITMHGGAYGTFTINKDLPKTLQYGIFQPGKTYNVWVRYSSDVPYSRSEKLSTIGIGIKLFDVPGKNILDNESWPSRSNPDELATNADFTLQNYPVFFAKNAQQMSKFKTAAVNGTLDAFLAANPDVNTILNAMAQDVSSVLDATLWSCIPFKNGADSGQYCKYILSATDLPPKSGVGEDDPNYMKLDLQKRLSSEPATFSFKIHQRTSIAQSIDDAQDDWTAPDGSEDVANMIDAATLYLPQQDISVRGQEEYSESLSYNPWRTLRDHEPVGTIAEARRVVYLASSKMRRNLNGQSIGEPVIPRPPTLYPAGDPKHTPAWPPSSVGPNKPVSPTTDATEIVRVAIHPGIGVARVGNSMEEGNNFYIGSEVDTPPLIEKFGTRDNSGAIKRQAARFRLYGYNSAGEVVKEITAADATVKWSVHLANKKAQWFEFNRAFDMAENSKYDDSNVAVSLRNPNVADRSVLSIDPGEQSISGANAAGVEFANGKFMGTQVYLGELRTDEQGRLLVLGGRGKSASPIGLPLLNPDDSTFNNSPYWYDDISDGPVRAEVTIGGKSLPVDSAWVFVAPPNFAPNIVGFRTLYDLLYETYINAGMLPAPQTISFTQHILPSLQHLSNLQWVNKGFHLIFSKGKEYDFTNPDLLKKLSAAPDKATGSDPNKTLRETILAKFHLPTATTSDAKAWPMLYGDAFGANDGTDNIFNINDPYSGLAISELYHSWLQRWVAGDFIDDWDQAAVSPQTLQDVALKDQPAMLDKAAMYFCLADTFHPGCEVTWPMRHPSMYRAPFRIQENTSGLERDYGQQLSREVSLQPGGPLYGQTAGGLTRWMALPWQGDTSRCRSGYDEDLDPYVPTFWPARVPNHVLTEADYLTVMDKSKTLEERQQAFDNRPNWHRAVLYDENGVARTKEELMQYMVAHFGDMGVIEPRPGPGDDDSFPDVIFVEAFVKQPSAHERASLAAAASSSMKSAAVQPLSRQGGEGGQLQPDSASKPQ